MGRRVPCETATAPGSGVEGRRSFQVTVDVEWERRIEFPLGEAIRGFPGSTLMPFVDSVACRASSRE